MNSIIYICIQKLKNINNVNKIKIKIFFQTSFRKSCQFKIILLNKESLIR